MDLADVSDPVEKFETMSRCAKEAEKAGFDAIFVYYESPERLALAPDPARHIVSSEHWMLRRASK